MNAVEFRAVRVACGLSAKEAAEEIGIARSYVVAAERSVADVPKRLAEWAEDKLDKLKSEINSPDTLRVGLGGPDSEFGRVALVVACRVMARRPVEIGDSAVRDNDKGKAIAANTRDGWELMRFRSIAAAARFAGMEPTGIAKCARGEYGAVRGIVWRRVDEYIGNAPVEGPDARARRYVEQLENALARGEEVARPLLDPDGFLECAKGRGFRDDSVVLFPHGSYGPDDMEVMGLREVLSERHSASRRKVTRIGRDGEPDVVYDSVGEAADDVIAMGLCEPGTKHSSVLGRISDAKRGTLPNAYGYEWR